tara:strand:+ start:238729 stop:239397 length:669 start_codon:yes stop_codon:yes gene_type:complete
MNKNIDLNMAFSKTAYLLPSQQHGLKSPAIGITRIPLERESVESGHATSFVSYQAGSFFPKHRHTQGEEIYVIDGVFSDENGDYPAGSYIRNPAGSCHSPFSKQGCTLFVKLNQFQTDDHQHIVIRPEEQQWFDGMGNLKVCSLHSHHTESTALVWWPANEVFQPHAHYGGEEIVVLKGIFFDEHGEYPAGSWIRNPHLSQHYPYVKEETLILVKVGHLKSS